MLFRACLLLVLGLVTAGAQPTIPDTPAGRTFAAWLEAFNSGDRERMDAYYRRYEKGKTTESTISFRNMTGGFELLEILKSERLHLEFLVKQGRDGAPALSRDWRIPFMAFYVGTKERDCFSVGRIPASEIPVFLAQRRNGTVALHLCNDAGSAYHRE